jgi:hypothetical protein
MLSTHQVGCVIGSVAASTKDSRDRIPRGGARGGLPWKEGKGQVGMKNPEDAERNGKCCKEARRSIPQTINLITLRSSLHFPKSTKSSVHPPAHTPTRTYSPDTAHASALTYGGCTKLTQHTQLHQKHKGKPRLLGLDNLYKSTQLAFVASELHTKLDLPRTRFGKHLQKCQLETHTSFYTANRPLGCSRPIEKSISRPCRRSTYIALPVQSADNQEDRPSIKARAARFPGPSSDTFLSQPQLLSPTSTFRVEISTGPRRNQSCLVSRR